MANRKGSKRRREKKRKKKSYVLDLEALKTLKSSDAVDLMQIERVD